MKAIIPLAGKGTRLRPQTYHTPKPLLKVGGRPVMSYILDDLVELGTREYIFVTGYLGDAIRDFVGREYPNIEAHYVDQTVQDGTAGAVKLAEAWVDDELLILFVDTLFDADLSLIERLDPRYAGVIWAKDVEDYQRFGVIVTREDGTVERIVEKPQEPISKLANIGLYYIRDYELLFEGIHEVLRGKKGPGGEYFLTDAFQYMVDHGGLLLTAPVEGWYDCGKLETLLDTNRHLLESGRAGVAVGSTVEDSEILEPVRIEEGAVVRNSTVGPNVTLGRGVQVIDSVLQHSLVGDNARVEACRLERTLIGAEAFVERFQGSLNVADHSSVVGSGPS